MRLNLEGMVTLYTHAPVMQLADVVHFSEWFMSWNRTHPFAFWDFQITRDENWSNFTFNGDLKIKHIINRLLFVMDKYMPIFHEDVVLGHVYYHVTETAVGYPWYNFY